MATPEAKIKAKLDKMLHEERVWFYSPQAGPFGNSGIPDRVAIVNGQFVGIEAKADKTKKPTRLQQHCMKQIENAGGKSFLVYDIETIERVRAYIHACRGESKSVSAKAQQSSASTGDHPNSKDA